MMSSLELLKLRPIIDIFIGDTKFETYEFSENRLITIKMPYLTGQYICDVAAMFGYTIQYDSSSRWMYFEILLGM